MMNHSRLVFCTALVGLFVGSFAAGCGSDDGDDDASGSSGTNTSSGNGGSSGNGTSSGGSSGNAGSSGNGTSSGGSSGTNASSGNGGSSSGGSSSGETSSSGGSSSGETSSSGGSSSGGSSSGGLPPLPGARKLAGGGGGHMCAIRDDGSLKCWGANNFGQLGLGDRSNRGDAPNEMGAILPVVDLGGKRALAVAAGTATTCVVLEGGELACFGRNASGILGIGSNVADRGAATQQMGANLLKTDLGANAVVVDVAVGDEHACALLQGGTVKCWGENQYGQLGTGQTSNVGQTAASMGDNLAPIDLGAGRTAKAISVGHHTSCAILDNDSLKCWGYGAYLGLEENVNRGRAANTMGDALPAVNLATLHVKAITAGSDHNCAIVDTAGTDTMKCWGYNYYGQLGFTQPGTGVWGASPNQMGGNLPWLPLGAGSVRALESDDDTTCAISADRSLYCWGLGDFGALGRGSTTSYNTPGAPVSLPGPATEVASAGSSTCARLEDGSIRCWGYGGYGTLGRGDQNNIGDGPDEMGAALAAVDLGP